MRTKWSNLCYYESDFVTISLKIIHFLIQFNQIYLAASLQDTAKVEYLKNLKVKLTDVSKYLGSHEYVAGNHVNIVLFFVVNHH